MSRLAQLARPRPAPPPRDGEFDSCELCGAPIAPEHRHLVDLSKAQLLCACRACTLLFDREAAGGDHYRLVPEDRYAVRDFCVEAETWSALGLPVELAFFFESTPAKRVVAFYPSPVGATESLLELDAWAALRAANPILAELRPDVEALLVNRAGGASDHMIVPIDECYGLVGLIRTRWRGIGGGDEVWEEIERFFRGLRDKAITVGNQSKEARWPISSSASRT